LYKSETKAASAGQHKWNMVNLLTSELANDDVEREIRMEFFESAKSGKHVNKGYISFNLAQLKEGTREFNLMDPKKGQPKANC